ncbi:putative YccA/Bax inhibitor family protein [Paenibacillus shirakamiensis]|uniref:YccA/Bax inhibitor family protein n=1 Tax=Paenibacillus shirakamiensis TaxID=1265935 RepID=A0ABS4JJW9_9BACL|nr:Bax inhibitor-1/YccA family protein [Paenibacillus shirakamiensis]MBP2001992.1 putative YccA/Bax inhibitor family protein [Paenibacillus shirakamiensis]
MLGRSGNPTLKDQTFRKTGSYPGYQSMTLDGTLNKTLITLVILLGGAFGIWSLYYSGQNIVPYMAGGAIIGLVLALVISFVPTFAPYLVPLYALAEGLMIGGLSAIYENLYHGITLQAALLTLGVALALLFAYKTRIIQATENFKMGVFAATAGIALVYLLNIILQLFGVTIPYLHSNGPIGIVISIVIVIVAALNLILDFDFIEKGVQRDAPKYMEWYGAFGLMVTLVWLYVEMLRLLSKVWSRD